MPSKPIRRRGKTTVGIYGHVAQSAMRRATKFLQNDCEDMIIQLKKFGVTLVSRPSGKEAWLAFQPVLNKISGNEELIVDFNGVVVLTPSWADEFLTPLRKQFNNRVKLRNLDNPSVTATLAILAK